MCFIIDLKSATSGHGMLSTSVLSPNCVMSQILLVDTTLKIRLLVTTNKNEVFLQNLLVQGSAVSKSKTPSYTAIFLDRMENLI